MASLLQNVQKYIGMRDADRVQTCATESFAGNLKCFTHTLANVLEDPCHAQKTPYVCKYDYIMEHYLKELGVPVKVPMNSSSNFKKVLQYHWSQMVVGSTEGTQVDPKTLELIVKKVDLLELCELLDADPRQETEALNIFGKSMEQELMNSTAGFRKCVAKIDKDRSSSRFPFFNLWDTPTSNAEAGSPSSLVPSPIQSKGHNITHRKEICSICTVLSSSFMLFYNLRTRRNKRRIILKKSSRGWRRRFGLVKTSMIRQPPAVTSWIWSKSKSKKKHLRIRYFCFLVILD